jgi:hypothetical protein
MAIAFALFALLFIVAVLSPHKPAHKPASYSRRRAKSDLIRRGAIVDHPFGYRRK